MATSLDVTTMMRRVRDKRPDLSPQEVGEVVLAVLIVNGITDDGIDEVIERWESELMLARAEE